MAAFKKNKFVVFYRNLPGVKGVEILIEFYIISFSYIIWKCQRQAAVEEAQIFPSEVSFMLWPVNSGLNCSR